MFYITKKFEVPISHRLSKHLGLCKLYHGHNLLISVCIKSSALNDNDMVMDFSELKSLVNKIISSWDHGMFINICDEKLVKNLNAEIHAFNSDPTSEILCRYLYFEMKSQLEYLNSMNSKQYIFIHSVDIWETRDSKSTYME